LLGLFALTFAGPRLLAGEGQRVQVFLCIGTVFKEPTDEELYVLIAARWFRAWTNDGPWEVVPRGDLPSDILAIPDTSTIWHGTRAVRAVPRR